MVRAPGLSVRLKLTLSYAGFLMLAGALLLAVVWVFLLRYVPEVIASPGMFVPNQSDLVRAFAPRAAAALAFLLLFGDVCFEPREHGVEGVGEFAELVLSALHPDPVGERSVRGHAGGVRDPGQRG